MDELEAGHFEGDGHLHDDETAVMPEQDDWAVKDHHPRDLTSSEAEGDEAAIAKIAADQGISEGAARRLYEEGLVDPE